MRKKINVEDSLRTIIPKIANGIQQGTLKLKSMDITNTEDLRLRKLKKIYNIDECDLIFVAMQLLQNVIRGYLITHLKNSNFLIKYETAEEMQADIENVILPEILGENTEAYLFALNFACALQGQNVPNYYKLLFQSRIIKILQTDDGKEALQIYENIIC